MPFKAPKGTQDLLPSRSRAWERFVAIARETFSLYGYEPIETPVFEHSDLFTRGCGEDTDVATKEMFSVHSMGAMQHIRANEPLKADQRLALRPEGTASVVRAIAEHGLITQGGAPVKLFYAAPMFRCERPQKGRLREFRQVGVECLGATDASADAEMIVMCMRFFEALGIPASSMRLLINSMGCEQCRPGYTELVGSYLQEHSDELCDECRRRAQTNPLRAFDCKNPQCSSIMDAAPRFSEHLCEDCAERYAQVKAYLEQAGIAYEEDPRLVRGFDYYTGTVFEVQVSEGLGSQSAIGGGGRYDRLMSEIGAADVPGLGFAVGFERIMLVLEAAGVDLDPGIRPFVYVALVDASVRSVASKVAQTLRDAGFATLTDSQGRSLKSQLKLADRSGARLSIVLGPDEVAADEFVVRDLRTHTESPAHLDTIVEVVASMLC